MSGQSRAIVLLACAVLGTGCMSDEALGPDATSLEQTRLSVRVSPSEATLFAASSGNTVLLSVEAFDDRATLQRGSYAIAYSSSAPQIASVSEDGLVTGVAPGLAMITATVTFGGVTRVATTRVLVAVSPLDSWRIAGIYDLTATVTLMPYLGEPGGGPSYQVFAVLTFPSGSDVPTFTDLRVLNEAGNPVYWATDGSIGLSLPTAGALFGLVLGNDWGVYVQLVEKPGADTDSSPFIQGSLGGVLGNQWYGGSFYASLRGSAFDER